MISDYNSTAKRLSAFIARTHTPSRLPARGELFSQRYFRGSTPYNGEGGVSPREEPPVPRKPRAGYSALFLSGGTTPAWFNESRGNSRP